MPEDSDHAEGDLPDPGSGETFTDLDSLKESIAEGQGGPDTTEPDSERETGREGTEADSGETDASQSGGSSPQGTGSDTVRMTFHVDRETAERLRNAVYWTATPVTLSGTARDALKAAVRQLEERFNDGQSFPDRDEELKGGNPNLKG
ncbi:hypothetical protein [Salinibacter altiplanensis]|uniref:hypothetical protein n=1 Tax=Salinibacter altiplanensis TaxID=1803181 RepID=UPI000C9EE516|nr:hypothetical protein [Salinibacter altiplanensis]